MQYKKRLKFVRHFAGSLHRCYISRLTQGEERYRHHSQGMLLRMTSWTELTQDWANSYTRAKTRFPNLLDCDMPYLKLDRGRFESYLAERHQLTLEEARQELEDFLFVESLNRELGD